MYEFCESDRRQDVYNIIRFKIIYKGEVRKCRCLQLFFIGYIFLLHAGLLMNKQLILHKTRITCCRRAFFFKIITCYFFCQPNRNRIGEIFSLKNHSECVKNIRNVDFVSKTFLSGELLVIT